MGVKKMNAADLLKRIRVGVYDVDDDDTLLL